MAKVTRKGTGSKGILDRDVPTADYQSWIEDAKIDEKANKSTETASHTGMIHRLKAASMMQKLVDLCEQDSTINPEILSQVKMLQIELQFAFASDMTEHLTQHNVPEVAPELWLNRQDERKENPWQFIERAYSDYLGKGLSRPDIRRLDPSLYQAFSNWKSNGGELPDNFDELLPGRKKMNSIKMQMAGMSRDLISPEAKEVLRLYHVLMKRIRDNTM
ncbi:MAG: hypothetical protein P4M05_21120 [Bradyrhizobium sp.]|nr:hypothetical protein [Bradyrhizobium sp.]